MTPKEKRPVRCYICGGQMYYFGEPKHEQEYKIQHPWGVSYVHARCLKMLRNTKQQSNRK